MPRGAITDYIDVAQLTLYLFWIFFAGLIYYLRREDKREGYPLESDRSGRFKIQGFPSIPSAKTFHLSDGSMRSAPRAESAAPPIRATPVGNWPGAPLEPDGNPMLDAVGPAAYAQREDVPDKAYDGTTRIVPLRVATDYTVAARDPDPRGMLVLGADRIVGGVVRDLWVDRAEAVLRYLEVEVTGKDGAQRVLLPMNFARVNKWRKEVRVQSILGRHFADVPALRSADSVTLREEDRICAYYASGHLYAKPSRLGPVL